MVTFFTYMTFKLLSLSNKNVLQVTKISTYFTNREEY